MLVFEIDLYYVSFVGVTQLTTTFLESSDLQ